jgi:lipopolysaccharide export system protein LptA
MLIGMLPRGGRAEEARAATHGASTADQGEAGRNPLLGALSFTSSRQPITVTAGKLEFDYRERVLKYDGDVVVTQGDMKLQSNTLTVTLDEHAQDRVKEVVADGDVRLSQGARWATGGHVVFDQTQHTVVLSQSAVVHDGSNHVSGERIVVYLDEQRSVVEGGSGRVQAVLVPSKGDATPTLAEKRP